MDRDYIGYAEEEQRGGPPKYRGFCPPICIAILCAGPGSAVLNAFSQQLKNKQSWGLPAEEFESILDRVKSHGSDDQVKPDPKQKVAHSPGVLWACAHSFTGLFRKSLCNHQESDWGTHFTPRGWGRQHSNVKVMQQSYEHGIADTCCFVSLRPCIHLMAADSTFSNDPV